MTTWLERMNEELARYDAIKVRFGAGTLETIAAYREVKYLLNDAQSVARGDEAASAYVYTGDPQAAVKRWSQWTIHRT